MVTATQMISRESQRVEVSASNIANVATPGYKRQLAFQSALGLEALQQAQTEQRPVGLQAMTRATDFSAGKLQPTGNALDLAVTGPGFFQLATEHGTVYARTASFHRNADGQLVTAQGARLQAAGGGDVLVSGENWKLSPDGTVVDNGNPATAVRLVEFDEPEKLSRTGGNTFAASTDAHLREVGGQADGNAGTTIRQGYLEAANVSVGDDMVKIMEAMRRIESGQKLVHVYDDMVGTALQRLGGM